MHVSVITPAYNVALYVGQAVASVCAQTHTDWTMTVIDDGSTDGTAAVVASCADRRVQVVRQVNAGVSAARNTGLAHAPGDAVLFLDADDWLAPDAMARMVAALQGTNAVAAHGAFCFVSEDGGKIVGGKPGPFPEGDILTRLLEENLFANGGHMLIRRAAVDAAGRFLSGIAYGEDWEYWIRVALQGRFVTVPGAAPLLFVRQRQSGAYLRLALNPDSFQPCMEAIFANPMLMDRLGAAQLPAIRRRTEAENAWIIGRELVRHGRHAAGLSWLRRSFRAKPTAKRAALLAAAHGLSILPERLRGPFRSYATA
jgi:glycosyltransferase involved in cell wall biosynthesis